MHCMYVFIRRKHARRETTYGMRYEIRAAIQTPSGRQVFLRSIWQIDLSATAPRLITLYPD